MKLTRVFASAVPRSAFFGLLALAMAAFPGLPVQAEVPDMADEITTHLEFLGYSVKVEESQLVANHEAKFNVGLTKVGGGILATTWFTDKKSFADENPDAFVALANKLNVTAVLMRVYIDNENDMAFEAWFPGEYERKRFGLFLTSLNDDISRLIENNRPEVEKFLN